MVARVLENLIEVYMVLILLRALSKWLELDARKTAVKVLSLMTDPVLTRIRRVVPPVGGGIDISPVIAVLALWVIGVLLRGVS
jgi:YggT family protein